MIWLSASLLNVDLFGERPAGEVLDRDILGLWLWGFRYSIGEGVLGMGWEGVPTVVGNSEKAGDFVGCGLVALRGRSFFSASECSLSYIFQISYTLTVFYN